MEEKFPYEYIPREVLVRKEGKTNPELSNKEKKVEDLIHTGIINLNKGKGPTSHMHVAYLKEIFEINKAGHSGTLDPAVTGCLPTALDRGSRIVQVLLPAGKEYICLMYLHKPVDEGKFNEVMKGFIGKITQLPPVRSAVKRRYRERNVYYMNIIEQDGQYILFKIGCQAGTYIRKYVHNLGEDLGVGAHMVQLIRTRVGEFNLDNSHTLHDIVDAYQDYKQNKDETKIRKVILPMEVAVKHLPKVWIFDGAVDPVCNGFNLFVPGISKVHDNIQRHDLVAVMSLKDELVCIGEAEVDSEKMLTKGKGLAVITNKVFMDRGIYKMNKGNMSEPI